MVVDNVLDNTSIQDYLVDRHHPQGRGHVLIMSKNPFMWSDAMNITPLVRSESIALLHRIIGTTDQPAVKQLAEILGDFPLATQCASYVVMIGGSRSVGAHPDGWYDSSKSIRHVRKSFVVF